MSNYSSQLRDPRWQRKRLEVMERDKFSCQWCRSKEKTLNVHHVIYQRGKAPWEYDAGLLLTLCENCHVTFDKEFNDALVVIITTIVNSGYKGMLPSIMEIFGRYAAADRWLDLEDLSYDDGYAVMRLIAHMLHKREVSVMERIRLVKEGGAKCTA